MMRTRTVVSISIVVIAISILIAIVTIPHPSYDDTDLSDAFDNGLFIIDSAENTVEVSVDDVSEYRSFVWNVFDVDHTYQSFDNFHFATYDGEKFVTPDNRLTLPTSPGEYRISADCIRGNSAEHYEGLYVNNGAVIRSYDWDYGDTHHSFRTSFDYDEYRSVRSIASEQRNGTSYSDVTEFVVCDRVIEDMNKSLAECFASEYDEPLNTRAYAEFILAFVQICFDYPENKSNPDLYIYGTDEYYAYPLETIFRGIGDCEDTSILCASLFKAAGFDAAVAIISTDSIPRSYHSVAGVCLNDFDDVASNRLSLMYQTIDGKTYYACETILDTNLYGIGYVDSAYSNDCIGLEGPGGRFGFYVVDA